ncbi:ModE family transcriptional regulator [Cupriavidus necator]|uniref:ModE family transcriptional regulator n=1 Tax=Cupriavidus necator TaxID=106590 RepID=A0A1U9V1P3_CUPNE|nr:LysR family transcriptional regulator [Cupriavidus necator]AQV98886.1 ModE family transcriptional regulator [Cupriavidus necator]
MNKRTATTARAARAAAAPSVRFRLRVTVADVIAFGPGKIALLEAVRDCGSISAGARSLGMSYRRAWVLLQEINTAMRSPAVLSEHGGEHGGGSVLTPEGEAAVRLYRAIEKKAAAACARDIAALLGLLAQ